MQAKVLVDAIGAEHSFLQFKYPLRLTRLASSKHVLVGWSAQVLRSVAAEVAVAVKEGIEVAIVVGGGNYFRGVDAWDGLDRATADHMGMLATCMNAICLQVSA